MESRHACGDLTSLKGDHLIATLLDGEVFTTRQRLLWFSWANGKDLCRGRAKSPLQIRAGHH